MSAPYCSDHSLKKASPCPSSLNTTISECRFSRFVFRPSLCSPRPAMVNLAAAAVASTGCSDMGFPFCGASLDAGSTAKPSTSQNSVNPGRRFVPIQCPGWWWTHPKQWGDAMAWPYRCDSMFSSNSASVTPASLQRRGPASSSIARYLKCTWHCVHAWLPSEVCLCPCVCTMDIPLKLVDCIVDIAARKVSVRLLLTTSSGMLRQLLSIDALRPQNCSNGLLGTLQFILICHSMLHLLLGSGEGGRSRCRWYSPRCWSLPQHLTCTFIDGRPWSTDTSRVGVGHREHQLQMPILCTSYTKGRRYLVMCVWAHPKWFAEPIVNRVHFVRTDSLG